MTTVTQLCAAYPAESLVADPYPSFVPTQPNRPVRPVQPERPVRPLDPPMVPFALAGTGVWAVVGLILLVTGAPDKWLWTCLAGFLLGLALLLLMVIRDRKRSRRRT